MTMKQIAIASTFVFVSAGAASAQSVPPFHFEPVQIEPVHIEPFNIQVEKIHTLAQAYTPFRVELGKNQNKSVDGWYSQARGFIDRDQYDRALEPLDRVITAKGDRADAATYWKAYSLWKLARRDEALSVLADLQKQFPDSRWRGDARALEVEVKQAAGQAVSANAVNDELKLLALQGLTRTDPETAFPVIEKMLAGGSSVRVKQQALFVLSQSRADRGRTILANVARGNANPELQQTAIRYLGISNTPESVAALESVYKSATAADTKRAVISALMSSRNNTGAINSLITLARAERDPELKTQMVRYLSTSTTPEAKAFMLEILN